VHDARTLGCIEIVSCVVSAMIDFYIR